MTHQPSRKQLKEFGLFIGLAFPLVFGWLLPALFGHGFRSWTLWIGIPSLILGLVAPQRLAWPYRGWMAFGNALEWTNSHVVLGLVFLVILQPIAFVMRLLGHDPLRRKANGKSSSYRELRQHHTIDLKRIF
ncbi:MAG: SxtJ family membrane protein [Synechococcus sp.]|nr:SxtJ family membrane protein [Synechococcus sp.]